MDHYIASSGTLVFAFGVEKSNVLGSVINMPLYSFGKELRTSPSSVLESSVMADVTSWDAISCSV